MQKIRVIWIAVLLVLFGACACAQEGLYPPLEDPVDQMVQRMAVMSQRDEAFEGVPYDGGLLTQRGCLPVSMANSVIAAFDIRDKETAEGVVTETARVLVDPRKRGKVRAELRYLPTLLSVQDRAEQAEKFPVLAGTIGAYAGEILFLDGQLSEEMTRDAIDQTDRPYVLVGRQSVHPDWTEMVKIISALHELGLKDARVVIAHVGAGTEASGAPLRSGNGGHYVTLLLHVGTFMEEGRVYLLDSLPRAIEGEESGYTMILRKPYPYTQGYSKMGELFDSARISPTVIRLTLMDAAPWQAADAKGKADILKPLIVFGPGVVMISVNQ